MNQEYTFPKLKFQKDKVDFLWLFFDNHNYFPIDGSELLEISVNLYDRLIWNGKSFSPVAESGYLKFRIKEKAKMIYDEYFLYNPDEYKKSRKSYVENRCVKEGGMKFVQLFNEFNWHYTLFGNMVAEMDGDFLVLRFLPTPGFGEAGGKYHVAKINDIKRSMVRKIDLSFENCDGFTVYRNEIVEINLDFNKELVWGSWDLLREISGGYLKLRLDKKIDYRHINAFFAGERKAKDVKQLERRICGKGWSTHDLCHLYVEYNYFGFETTYEECLEIDDVRPDEEIERLEKLEEKGEGYLDFIGGYSKRLDNGTILITFGKSAKKLIDKIS